jgi:hypothetical protein
MTTKPVPLSHATPLGTDPAALLPRRRRLSLSKCFVVWAVTSDPTGKSFGLAAG